MVVQHNMRAANASRMLNITTNAQSKSTEKLSSGYRINRAADDAAGLSISEKMRKQIRGLDQASTNASDGVSAVQTAEGALTEVHSMLQRMNELAVQAANGTNSSSDRDDIQSEIDQLTDEIDRIAETTKFNATYLLKGDNGLKDMYINAHDAGLEGTLIENKTAATFTMNALSAGDSYTIGGTKYTIGAEDIDEVQEALHVTFANMSNGDTITIDGKTFTIETSTDIANAKISNAKIAELVVAGSTVKYNGNSVTMFSEKVEGGIDQANKALIKATAAYAMVRTELTAASSVGATDQAATTNDYTIETTTDLTTGEKSTTISFKINKGYVEVQNALSFNLHVGSDADMTNKITVVVEAMDSKSLGIDGLNVADNTGKIATYAIDAIADAIERVSAQRSSLGAIQNRLEHSIANLDNVVENTEAAESRIRDTDMADEMVTYSKNNILAQAGQSMLAQANQATQGVLSLLQ